MAKYLSFCSALVCLLCVCSCQQKTNRSNSEQNLLETVSEKIGVKNSLLSYDEYMKMGIKYSEESQDVLLKKASNDDADAMFELARRADNPLNSAEAFRLYRQAAENGHIAAQFRIGQSLIRGYGVEQNVEEGKRWLEKSANNGDPYALLSIANYYANGEIYEQNGKKAIELAQKVIKAGIMGGYQTLGYVYKNGISVSQDRKKAFSYFMKGTEGDRADPSCEAMVGVCYYEGSGVEQDMDKGITWLQLAARHGSDDAITILQQLGAKP